MTIDKAIEILHDLINHSEIAFTPDELDATKLALEALKAVKSARANHYWTPIPPLPGEDPEKPCQHKTIRDWPDCYEDCDYAGTYECPHHKSDK